jgi:anoctamin-10
LTIFSINDWIHGIRTEAPDRDLSNELNAEPLHEAERLRIVYQLITQPETEGGAGIAPKYGEWKQVDDIFPLHDHEFNNAWIKEISSSYLLKPEQIDKIRNRFGEEVG